MIGQKFYNLFVKERYDNDQQGRILFLCQCDCGKEIIVRGTDLRNGRKKSCGCKKIKDLSQTKCRKLQPLFPTEERQSGSVVWQCRCDCGNVIKVSARNLTNNNTLSCGCITSSIGEKNIENILKDNNISYEKEKIFSNFIYSNTGGRPRFDFYLPDFNRLIEFDGKQHFIDTGWTNQHINFEKRKFQDELKNMYAKENNIELIRIPYWERDNITLEMILGNQYLQ